MAAPLVVRSAEDLKLDAQEVTVLLHDFTFRNPAEVLAHVTGGRGMQHGGMMMQSGMMMPQQMAAGWHAGHAMSGMTMDLNDVNFDAYLANDRTLDDPLVVRVERNGRVRLRLISHLDGLLDRYWRGHRNGSRRRRQSGAADDRQSISDRPRAAPRSLDPDARRRRGDHGAGATRGRPYAHWHHPRYARRQSHAACRSSAAVGPIDLSIERRLVAATPLPAGGPSVSHRIALTGSMMPYAWSIDGHGWANRKPLRVKRGQRVVLEMVNRSPMAHPMHLHGHHFQVVGINGKALQGAMRDTVLVPIDSAMTIAFDADNPGNWLLHCHNLLHMAAGMMTEVAYGPS